MDNKIEVIGIDHGWSGMKTVHEVFTSGCKEISTEPAFTENLLEYGGKYYKIGSKRLEVKDTNTTDTAYTYIVLDTAKTSGVYKISGTLYMPTQNGSWSPFQLIGSNVQTNSDIAFAAIRSDGSKKLGISTDNTNTMSATTANAYTKETDITFEIVLDLDAKTVTLKIGNEEVVSATNAIDISNSLGTNGWQGIRLQTAGGARNIYLSNLTIAERVVDTTPEA